MPAEAKKTNSAVVTVRATSSIALPPCQLGFGDLTMKQALETAERFGDVAKFSMDGHYNPAGILALQTAISTKVIEAMLEKLYEQGDLNGFKRKPAMSVEEWIEAQLKQPKEKSKVQLPFIKLRRPAQFKDRQTDTMREKPLSFWGPTGQELLDFSKLRLGMGSIVAPIVYGNMFMSKAASMIPTPSLKLVGMRVLALKQYGGRGAAAPEAETDEAIKAVMGASFSLDDNLAAYAAGDPSETPHDVPDEEHDDEGAVKGMF